MSLKLEARVWDMRGLPEHLKIVLARMATLANDDGWCQVGQVRLGEEMDRDDRTIRRRLELLDRLGLVEKLRRHRRGDQEYRLHIPEDPERMSWRDPVSLLMTDGNGDISLDHGWFNQDRPQVPGQAKILLEGLAPPLERRKTPANQDRTQDRTPVTPRPDTGDSKTGHGRPVPKGEDAKTRARPLHEDPILEADLLELAREKARKKGAHNLAAFTQKILREDRSELEDEIRTLRAEAAWLMTIANCVECDAGGRAWFTKSGEAVSYDDPDADTATICDHGGGE